MEKSFVRRRFLSKSFLGASGFLSLSMPSVFAGAPESNLSDLFFNLLNAGQQGGNVEPLIASIWKYLSANQEHKPGEYFGSIWSEKAYHGPILNYHAGGSHHHRGAGSSGLVFYEIGKRYSKPDLLIKAEHCFDWLSVRQHARGGFFEIQNNEKPSDWEGTGEDECSTIETAFVVHGLGRALLKGLPPKKQYMDCLKRAGMWQLETETIPNSGIFPHHERSPWDTLNANMHAAETLVTAFCVLKKIYGIQINIFKYAAERAVKHTLNCQWENGCFPYRSGGVHSGVTINYTSLVLWCLFNIRDLAPEILPTYTSAKIECAMDFLVGSFDKNKGFLWEDLETTTAKYNIWTYAITASVLQKSSEKRHIQCATEILEFLQSKKTDGGLLPMRDRGEVITECAFMQADIGLFLMEFLS
jgi:hypothetical protein